MRGVATPPGVPARTSAAVRSGCASAKARPVQPPIDWHTSAARSTLGRVEDRGEVGGEVARVERVGRARRATEAAVVEGDDAMARREEGNLLPPRERAAAGSVHEYDGRPRIVRRAVLLVVQRRAVLLDRRHRAPMLA